MELMRKIRDFMQLVAVTLIAAMVLFAIGYWFATWLLELL